MVQKKFQKDPGINIVTQELSNLTIKFPKLALPQYYVNKTVGYKTVENTDELNKKLQLMKEGINVKLQWGGEFIVSKDSEDARLIKGAVDELWDKYGLGIKGGKYYPIKDGDEICEQLEAKGKSGSYYKNTWKFKSFTNLGMPKLYNEEGEYFIKNDADVDGYFCRLIAYVDFYTLDDDNYKGGVRIYLNNLQFLQPNPKLQFGVNPANAFSFKPKKDSFEAAAQQAADLPDNNNDDGVPFD